MAKLQKSEVPKSVGAMLLVLGLLKESMTAMYKSYDVSLIDFLSVTNSSVKCHWNAKLENLYAKKLIACKTLLFSDLNAFE